MLALLSTCSVEDQIIGDIFQKKTGDCFSLSEITHFDWDYALIFPMGDGAIIQNNDGKVLHSDVKRYIGESIFFIHENSIAYELRLPFNISDITRNSITILNVNNSFIQVEKENDFFQVRGVAHDKGKKLMGLDYIGVCDR